MTLALPPANEFPTSGVSNLLPELLLGLLGHIGGAFVLKSSDSNDASEPGIPTLSNAVDWITLPEREQLDSLVRLGHYFARLEAFVDSLCDHNPGSGPTSIYHAAFASGLEELLDVYRNAVLQVEQRLLRPPIPPLLSLRHFLSDFEVLLPEAASIVHEVQQKQLSAAQLMHLLDRRTRCGIPAVQACAERLLWHCNGVMFKQLESWMVYGILFDPGNEFFIRNASKTAREEDSTISGLASGDRLENTKTPPLGRRGAVAVEVEASTKSLDIFQVAQDALPPAVPAAVAESALFVGKSVRILRHSQTTSRDQSITTETTTLDATAELSAFSQTLRSLQQEDTLRPAALRYAIETLQTKVASMLWDLIRQKCDLNGQLTALQSYFLLGRGDVYQQLMQDAAGLWARPPALETASADWSHAFNQAAINSAAESDPFFSSFSLQWINTAAMPAEVLPPWHPARDATLYVPAYNQWDGLCLKCTAEWPIQLLLPAEVLQKYSALWQFMFRLRRAQMDLEQAWGALTALERPASRPHGGGNSSRSIASTFPNRSLLLRLGQLRQRMTHFASNLALYLRLDVAESAGATLRSSIASAKDFTEADAAHKTYVETLTAQACLDIKQLMAAVEAIFGLIKRLCGVIHGLETEEKSVERATKQAEELSATFRLKHNVVFQLLQSNKLQSGPRAAGLRQLVMRLNFNHFCEQDVLSDVSAMAAASVSGRLSTASSIATAEAEAEAEQG